MMNFFNRLMQSVVLKYYPIEEECSYRSELFDCLKDDEANSLLFDIHECRIAIQTNPVVSKEMKEYANLLVRVYLPAALANIECLCLTQEALSKLDKAYLSTNDLLIDTLQNTYDTLSDINSGVVFKNNIGITFVSSVDNFNKMIGSRQKVA